MKAALKTATGRMVLYEKHIDLVKIGSECYCVMVMNGTYFISSGEIRMYEDN